MKMDDYAIIVRSVGERTTKKCVEYITKATGIEDICIINGVSPFQEMLKKCFDMGVEKGCKWTICIDADIIIEKNGFKQFIDNVNYLTEKEKNFFSISPCFYDYIFGCSRHVGLHLYNTALLSQAKKMIVNDTLRPETTVKRKMADVGYKSYLVNVNVGIHDFFNSYESILMKGLLHIKKHSNKEELVSKWKIRAETEEDFRWLCNAVKIAENYSQKDVKVDANWTKNIIKRYYPEIPQKPELLDEEIDEALRKYSNICIFQIVSGYKSTEKKCPNFVYIFWKGIKGIFRKRTH